MNGVSRMLLATKSAIIKLQELYFKHGNKKALQLKVTSGGCSGFQYNFSLANPYNNLRIVSELPNCMPVVADDDSIMLVSGAKIDYVTSIVARKFILIDIPKVYSECSCGNSFETA
ncbi:Iron-sulfur assembly protein IscA-like 2 mitochondrial [Babesia microti strain RI]|uniref:Iron-sulfur assembly protein IscA-like 2 mitochondrial n=1 Tax=Babesia microti (strain RI) TaxID=1133968 RepID=I7JDC4_BABMR|nr:Iron-sulfur assembly protein IscA-like 2 mitochondrial [Babesia microti strain RI]CCF75715.1 Iron-sulfur assembly protein IscA-like 2 mitochondrial [Babesia microti strain RI]|eukprot:XP_012650123.1 Iron-sulfur assembly protein IscA-like 2 mitochondrial [Babesia microti strain RI]